MEEILNIIHKTIYQFFDACEDDEEVPMSDKDKLLLEVNKAICNNLKALDQKPCEDAISRREAIKMFTYNYKGERIPDYDCDNFPTQIYIKTVKEMLRGLPSVTPKFTDAEIQKMQELEQAEIQKAYELGKVEMQPCEDCINRQAVLEIFGYVMDYWKEHAIDVEPHEIKDALIEQYEFTAKQLNELPSVTPQPKIGKWINVDGTTNNSDCSCCGNRGRAWMKYCYLCGSKMEVDDA